MTAEAQISYLSYFVKITIENITKTMENPATTIDFQTIPTILHFVSKLHIGFCTKGSSKSIGNNKKHNGCFNTSIGCARWAVTRVEPMHPG